MVRSTKTGSTPPKMSTGRMGRTVAFRNGFVAAPLRPCATVARWRLPSVEGEDTILNEPRHGLFGGESATAQQGTSLVLRTSIALRGAEVRLRQPGHGICVGLRGC